jgi:hypothetical protein
VHDQIIKPYNKSFFLSLPELLMVSSINAYNTVTSHKSSSCRWETQFCRQHGHLKIYIYIHISQSEVCPCKALSSSEFGGVWFHVWLNRIKWDTKPSFSLYASKCQNLVESWNLAFEFVSAWNQIGFGYENHKFCWLGGKSCKHSTEHWSGCVYSLLLLESH